jgi:hypothetical protein
MRKFRDESGYHFYREKEKPPCFRVVSSSYDLATNSLGFYRPCRPRTCDTLIKSYGVSNPRGKEVKWLVLTP